MAQVYSFTDENGQTRLLAEIHPDPAGTPFNGGTITNELVIQPVDPADALLSGYTADTSTAALINVSDYSGDNSVSIGANGLQLAVGGSFVIIADGVQPTRFVQGIALANTAAPADGDLAAEQCALWFDPANGASKLMVKAKSSNGTVVTAAIALA